MLANMRFSLLYLLLPAALLFSAKGNTQLPVLQLPELDLEKLLLEDREKDFDIRCAVPSTTEVVFQNGRLGVNGKIIVEPGPQKEINWTYTIHGKNALGITLLLKNMFLPSGASLTVSNADSSEVMVYNEKDNNSKKILTIGMISGNTARIHYREPKNCPVSGSFEIFRAYQAYEKTHALPENRPLSFGFGTSLSCNINIHCPGTDSVKNIKRGISRVMMVLKEGIGYCTGNLLNNTNQDGKPLILTAFHCQDGYTPMYDFWKFDFNYESPDCINPVKEPKPNRMSGCVRRAGWRNTDFLLLELNSIIPDSFNVFFNGWDRSFSIPSGRTYYVHHPSGDIKKYSADDKGTTSVYNFPIQWNNNVTTPATYHFRIAPSRGTFEVGSSGCGMYNSRKRFVGNFNGGDLNGCAVANGFFGRMAFSWEGGGADSSSLKKWLDPKNLGVTTLDGIEKPAPKQFDIECRTPGTKLLPCSAVIRMATPEGLALSDSVYLGTGKLTYKVPPYFSDISIRPVLNTLPREGLSTSDIVLIQKHILKVTEMTESWKLLAADANNNGSISVADIVDIRKLILSVIPALPKSNSWRFLVKNSASTPQFKDGTATFKLNSPSGFVEFQGIKIGDVNRIY